MPFKFFKALVLCSGLHWTSNVSALSRSESVPDCNILWRKEASEEEELDDEDALNVRISDACNDEALVVSVERTSSLTANGFDVL
jgi:hypothetical protein